MSSDKEKLTEWEVVKKNGKKINHSFLKNFQYKHDNPYDEGLGLFEPFVLRDLEGEQHKGLWNKNVFKNQAPLHVEIGTGFGHFMLNFCEKNPFVNFVGLDYRFKRSFQLAKRLSQMKTSNFRYLRAKGERIGHLFGESEIQALYYFFPDPWPKNRHHKKRLFQPFFLEQAFHCLTEDGEFFIKTDHLKYFQWMLEVLKECPFFTIQLQTFDLHREFPNHFLSQNPTKFEKIFLEKECPIKALVLKKNLAHVP